MVHQLAWDRLQQIENVEVESLISQKTKRSQTSRKTSISVASYKENLVEVQAKKAALQGKLKFAVTIAEQQQKLEQLKLEQELEAINAQEAIYQKAVDEEINVAINPLIPHLPNQSHHNPDTHTKEETEKEAVAPSHLNSTMPTIQPKISETIKPIDNNSSPCAPKGFAGNPPMFIPYNTREQGNSVQWSEAFIKMSQLQRLPQAKPSIFKGDEKDKTKFFLWQTAFDALIGSAPVTPEQKLHLLYQYLDGKAKRTVEQLQYMVQDPEKAYQRARSILKDRFGSNAILGADFERRLSAWPKISPNDPTALEEFSDFLQQVRIASEHISSLKVFDFPSQIQLLVEKLPGWFKTKWSDKIMKLQRGKGKDAFPSFDEFAETVKYHAERMNIPQILSSASLREPTKPSTHPSVRNSSIVNLTSKFDENDEEQAQEKENKRSTYCFYHKRATHATNECEQLQKLSFNERKEFLMKSRLCFNCVDSNQHIARNCKEGKQICKICQQEHATTLHNPTEHAPSETTEQTTSVCAKISRPNQTSCSCARIVLVQVFHQDNPLTRVPTYAVLDDQSTDVFVTDSLLSQLQAKGQDVNLEINTILGTNSVRTKKVNGLHIQDVEGRHQPIKIPHAYSRENIPASQSDIATPEIASKWRHLREISRHLRHRPDLEIGMLIGRNVPTALQPLRIIYGNEDEPWAEEYKFGWTVIGRAGKEGEGTQDRTVVNRVTVSVEEPETFFSVPSNNSNVDSWMASFATNCNRKDTTSPEQLREMMQLDYNKLHYSRTVRGTEEAESIEDQRFDRLHSQGIHQNDNGNWEMPLPFKTDDVSFPTNYEQCLKRLISLKKKLQRNPKVHDDYITFMQNIIDRKHADRVPKELVEDEEWLSGPDFLWDEKIILSNPESVGRLQPGDVEVKREKTSVLISDVRTNERSPKVLELDRFKNSCSLQGLKKGIACIQRAVKKEEARVKDEKTTDVEELRRAEVVILRSLQCHYFGDEMNILRRFINRRGKIRQLRSDQGMNFMGAKNELNKALGELDGNLVKNFLLSQDCDWIEFKENVPRNRWPLARVKRVLPSDDRLVRKVELLLTNGGVRRYLQRPVHKLVLLYAADEEVRAQGTTPTRSQSD